MASSPLVGSIGATCFGMVTGYITYRTLARTATPHVSDIAAVLGAVGGGAITAIYPSRESDAFGWYAIGLAAGMATYLILNLVIRGKSETAIILGEQSDPRPR